MSLTRKFVEQRLQKNRDTESKNAELRKMLVSHNILAGHGRSEAHVEELRRKRSEAAERRDLFMDYTYVKGAQDQERKNLVAEAEDRVADELSRRNAEQERQDQSKRRICEGSEELRVLKERLHAAKVNKERAQQLLEIEVRKERERRVDHRVAEHMENERLENIELEHKVEIEKMKQRSRVMVINKEQIATKEAKRVEAMQEYMKEKEQVQELVDRITNEDAKEQADKEQKRRESREMLMRFKIEQAERQHQQEQDEIEENNRIAQFAADKAEREERQALEKKENEKEKERILLSMLASQQAAYAEAEELAHLRNELHHEEHEHKARQKQEAAKQKRLDDKDDMRKAYVMQTAAAEQKKAEAQVEELKIRDTLLQKFAEDDRIEQMNDQKRRLRIEAHKREAQRLVEMRREAFQEKRNGERNDEQKRRDDEVTRQVVIEEERRRLIEEHALPLLNFLPKGTLRDEEKTAFQYSRKLRPDYLTKGKGPGNLTAR